MLDRVMSVDSQNTVHSVQTKKKSPPTNPLLQVHVVRQTSVSLSSSNSWKNSILAEASVTPVPPDLMSWYAPPGESCQESHIDWEGELRLCSETTVGGFAAGNVQVKVSSSSQLCC
jgi:hypothetical protein